MEYPKIETLYDRDPKTHKVIPGQIRRSEFYLPKVWLVTEKVDGTNIRFQYHPDEARLTILGRGPNSQIPVSLLEVLQRLITVEDMQQAFPEGDAVVELYGEGYGPRIQKVGASYGTRPGFVLFDVRVGPWWLEWDNVEDVAQNLGIGTVPVLGAAMTRERAEKFLSMPSMLAVANGVDVNPAPMEGIVCRTEPLLCDRAGNRIMWKLKGKDFA